MSDRVGKHARLGRLLTGLVLIAASPLPAAADNVANGQKIYMMQCAGCHGEYGVSPMHQVPSIAGFGLFSQLDSAEDPADVVRYGRDSMPPFQGILDEQEILDVLSFLRVLH